MLRPVGSPGKMFQVQLGPAISAVVTRGPAHVDGPRDGGVNSPRAWYTAVTAAEMAFKYSEMCKRYMEYQCATYIPCSQERWYNSLCGTAGVASSREGRRPTLSSLLARGP